MSVVLHVGCEKTGTKAIQHWLRDHERLLAENGMRFPRGWLRLNFHQELPLTLLRLDRMCSPRENGDEWRNPAWRADVLEQIREDLYDHREELTILSSENLDLMRFDDEFEELHALVGDAVIVIYLRDPEEWLVSLRHQYLNKNGPGRELSLDPEAYNYLELDTWRVDYDKLLAGWRRHFSHVVVRDYDAACVNDGSVIPSFVRELRELRLPVCDLDGYALNQWNDPTPRDDGNRTIGLYFGETP